MTTSHSNSSGRRHRGRRGRRSGNRGAVPNQNQEQEQGQTTTEVSVDEAAIVLPEQADVPAPVPIPVPVPVPRERPELGGRPRSDARPPMRPVRRRQPPRPAVGPMPTEVLKRGLELREPEFPLQLRPVASMIEATASNFGCPMLHRNQTALPSSGFQKAARCSLGWALHNQDEAMLCMYTAEMVDCWKAHPEKVEGLIEKIQQDEESAAAD